MRFKLNEQVDSKHNQGVADRQFEECTKGSSTILTNIERKLSEFGQQFTSANEKEVTVGRVLKRAIKQRSLPNLNCSESVGLGCLSVLCLLLCVNRRVAARFIGWSVGWLVGWWGFRSFVGLFAYSDLQCPMMSVV
jgi:hypothetical protein